MNAAAMRATLRGSVATRNVKETASSVTTRRVFVVPAASSLFRAMLPPLDLLVLGSQVLVLPPTPTSAFVLNNVGGIKVQLIMYVQLMYRYKCRYFHLQVPALVGYISRTCIISCTLVPTDVVKYKSIHIAHVIVLGVCSSLI